MLTYQATIKIDDPSIEETLDALRQFYRPSIRDLYNLSKLMGWALPQLKEWPEDFVFQVQDIETSEDLLEL